MGRFGRGLAIVAVACALAGAYNVFADNPGLESVARQEVCRGKPSTNPSACRSRLSRLRRSPFTQSYVFTTGGTEVEVDCARSFVLVGGYQCARQPRVDVKAPGAGDTFR